MSFSITTNKFTIFTTTLICVRLWLVVYYFHMDPLLFFFSPTNHSQPHEWVVAKIVHFFCGTRFFAKLLGYLVEPNKITCSRDFFFFFFFLLLSFYKIWTIHLTLHFHICKLFSILFKILNDNIIIFYFRYYCYKSKKLEYQKIK